MLVTVSKGSIYVLACIELLLARVLQFETLRPLMIILDVEGEEVSCLSSLPNNEFSESIFNKKDFIKDFE